MMFKVQRYEPGGVLVQRKFTPMLAWQLTGRCLCESAASQHNCFKMPS